MITVKTDFFEASVVPFNEWPITSQFPIIAALGADPATLLLAIIPSFRAQLSPDKLEEFDALSVNQINEILTQFITAGNEPKQAICEEGHNTNAECEAYTAGSRAERRYLIGRASLQQGRFARKLLAFLEGEASVDSF
jgi:hypothetical protein